MTISSAPSVSPQQTFAPPLDEEILCILILPQSTPIVLRAAQALVGQFRSAGGLVLPMSCRSPLAEIAVDSLLQGVRTAEPRDAPHTFCFLEL
jgi:hypothetical protein